MMPIYNTPPAKLTAGILLATLLIFALVIWDLARGGRPDPPALRAAAITLDGTWRFRTGDDPRWAGATIDDSAWETIDLTAPPGSHDGDVGLPDYVAGWTARGHPDYHGYAWYRRAVDVPAGETPWDILGPTLVDSGYEIFWNGELLGGSGRLGARPRLVGTRPLRFALPGQPAGTRGVVAIRAYLPPGGGASADGGGLHTPPILAPRAIAGSLHRAQWERTIAGYVVDAIEPLAMFAVIGLALVYRSRTRHPGFLALACIALALMAARRLNNAIVAWSDLQDLATYAWLAKVMWIPAVLAWSLAWNRWCLPAWRGVDAAAVLLAVLAALGATLEAASLTTASRWGSIALLVMIGARIGRHGDLRPLALLTLASILLGLFGGELLDPVGVPGIWFPFGIGVSRTQYIYAVAIPLIAVLFARTFAKAPPR